MDANRASTLDRRSTTGEILRWHGFPLMFVSRTQPTELLSISERGLSAIATGVADAILVQSILAELSLDVRLHVLSDATTAIAIARRLGLGRI